MLHTVKTVSFVSLNNLFQDCSRALDSFREDCGFSWGDNSHSLITKDDTVYILVEVGTHANPITNVEIETVISRIRKLPDGVFIDLES